jgi:hypothetical protein
MSYLDWHVGMKVVCVNSEGSQSLVKGCVYTIAAFDTEPGFSRTCGPTEFGIELEEANPNKHHASFHPARFRPVETKKTDISIFTAMLTDAKQRECA